MCVHELVQLDPHVPTFEKLGVSVYAISVDEPAKVSAFLEPRELHVQFACDPERQAITTLGIDHPGGGPNGSTIALPTQLLIDREGNVLWSYRSPDIRVRIEPERLLSEIRERISR
ncbi:MAG: redoxin domain-containing protein [Planctomycetes bacterium]|nr:redoxin domain-containing protein [Planctomycetota bacterium]